jgi:hypothetical protein
MFGTLPVLWLNEENLAGNKIKNNMNRYDDGLYMCQRKGLVGEGEGWCGYVTPRKGQYMPVIDTHKEARQSSL